jgi:hypothetical protein
MLNRSDQIPQLLLVFGADQIKWLSPPELVVRRFQPVPRVSHNLLHLTLYVTQLIIKEVRSAQRHVTTSYLSGYESTFSPTHNNVFIADFRGGKSPHIIPSEGQCFARRGGLFCEPIFPPDGRDYHTPIEV